MAKLLDTLLNLFVLVLCSCKVCKVPLVSGVLGALYKLVDNNNNNNIYILYIYILYYIYIYDIYIHIYIYIYIYYIYIYIYIYIYAPQVSGTSDSLSLEPLENRSI